MRSRTLRRPSPRTSSIGARTFASYGLHTFQPWAPHLNLPGPRLQRPAYEELIGAGTLPHVKEAPTATAEQKQKPVEKFVTLPSDAEQFNKTADPGGDSQRTISTTTISFFFSCAADTPMHVLDPQVPRPARQLSPAEREDSIPKRQKPAEVNAVLMIAGVYNGNEIACWTEDQTALQTAEQKDLHNMDKFGVLDVVDKPPYNKSSRHTPLETLGTKTTQHILQNANVAR